MITTAEELLKDTSVFAYRRVPEVPVGSLHLLAMHSDPAVRAAAAFLTPPRDIPCFVCDAAPRVNRIVAERINLS